MHFLQFPPDGENRPNVDSDRAATEQECTPHPVTESPADNPAYQLLVLPVEQVIGNDDQARQKERDEESWALFLDSIRQHGIKQPLLVRPITPERYLVVDGHGRLAAARRCGLKVVPCLVEQLASSEAEDLRLQFITNQHREGLSPLDQARLFQRLRKLGMTQKQIEATLGVSQSYVSDCLTVLKRASSEIIARIEKGTMSLKRAVAIVRAEEAKQKAGNGTSAGTSSAGEAATTPPLPSPTNGGRKRTPASSLNSYPKFEYRDDNTGLCFVACGKKKSSPPTENVLVALKRWVSVLELQVKHDL